MRVTRFVSGFLFILFGLIFSMYIYAFSSMVNSSLKGWDRFYAILNQTLQFQNWLAIAIGLAMISTGIYQIYKASMNSN